MEWEDRFDSGRGVQRYAFHYKPRVMLPPVVKPAQ